MTPALAWSALSVVGIALGAFARAPQPPAGMGRMFPRMPALPSDPRTLLFLLGVGSVVWNVSIIAVPLLLWRARMVDVERHHRRHAISMSLVAIAVMFALTTGIDYLLAYQGAPSRPGLFAYLPLAIRQDLVPCIAVVGIVAAIEARRRARHALIERERLRAEVAEQRLVALTGQLQPHFLFNTLQGISTLIHRDPEAADEMLAKLSDLLRELLRHRDSVLVPLGDELRYTRTYLEIAQIRFADRLSFDIDAALELSAVPVPLFILQPLVENALGHGIGALAQGGRIAVQATRDGDRLVLTVTDNGAGLQGYSPQREGVGLRNTRERLHASFADAHAFELTSVDGVTTARVVFPLDRHARGAQAGS